MRLVLRCLVVLIVLCGLDVDSIKISDVSSYCECFPMSGYIFCRKLQVPSEVVEFDISPKTICFHVVFEHSNLYTIPRNAFGVVRSAHTISVQRCSLKKIFKWNFEGQKNTVTLNLDQNLLEIVPTGVFEYLLTLQQLYLSFNNIDTLEENCFSGLEALQLLDLSNNKIRDIREDIFVPLKKLRTIRFSKNQLEYLPDKIFAHNPGLDEIDVRSNALKILDPKTPLALRSLADSQRVTSPAFFNIPNLQFIILSENYVPYIGRTTFSALKNLRHIGLNAAETALVDQGALDSLWNLESLSLEDNRLEHFKASLLEHTAWLEKLDLRNNSLKYLEYVALAELPNLRSISLSDNPWSCGFLEKMRDFFSSKHVSTDLEDSFCINEPSTQQPETTENPVSLSPAPGGDNVNKPLDVLTITLTTLVAALAISLGIFCGIRYTRICRQK